MGPPPVPGKGEGTVPLLPRTPALTAATGASGTLGPATSPESTASTKPRHIGAGGTTTLTKQGERGATSPTTSVHSGPERRGNARKEAAESKASGEREREEPRDKPAPNRKRRINDLHTGARNSGRAWTWDDRPNHEATEGPVAH